VPRGTRLRWREYELEIFHLGGQTYYHAGIATVVDGQRVIFVGDSFNAHPGVEPVLTYNDNDPATRGWLYAVERLIERRPDLLVCGHAAAVRSPREILELKRRLWREQVERYRQLSARDDLRMFFDPFV
jgi:glyoxylase-like metal-dependent hydrolase (beta-lactamase superfamily II)